MYRSFSTVWKPIVAGNYFVLAFISQYCSRFTRYFCTAQTQKLGKFLPELLACFRMLTRYVSYFFNSLITLMKFHQDFAIFRQFRLDFQKVMKYCEHWIRNSEIWRFRYVRMVRLCVIFVYSILPEGVRALGPFCIFKKEYLRLNFLSKWAQDIWRLLEGWVGYHSRYLASRAVATMSLPHQSHLCEIHFSVFVWRQNCRQRR